MFVSLALHFIRPPRLPGDAQSAPRAAARLSGVAPRCRFPGCRDPFRLSFERSWMQCFFLQIIARSSQIMFFFVQSDPLVKVLLSRQSAHCGTGLTSH